MTVTKAMTMIMIMNRRDRSWPQSCQGIDHGNGHEHDLGNSHGHDHDHENGNGNANSNSSR